MLKHDSISLFDAIGVVANIQTGFLNNFKEANKIYDIKDFRCNLFFSCYDLVTNSRLILSMLGYSLSNGMQEKEWWLKWGCYYPPAFEKIPDFSIFVRDKTGQLLWHTRDAISLDLFVFIEGFIRTIARLKDIESKDLYSVRDRLLKALLGFSDDDIVPLVIYQHLRNSVHNKGIHFNVRYPHLKFTIAQFEFEFKHNDTFYFDWYMLGELLLRMNTLLWNIVNHEQIKQLPLVTDRNFIIRTDNEE